MKHETTYRVHRFGDFIALAFMSPESKSTNYMTANMARSLARDLNKFAADCDKKDFAKSTIGTVTHLDPTPVDERTQRVIKD